MTVRPKWSRPTCLVKGVKMFRYSAGKTFRAAAAILVMALGATQVAAQTAAPKTNATMEKFGGPEAFRAKFFGENPRHLRDRGANPREQSGGFGRQPVLASDGKNEDYKPGRQERRAEKARKRADRLAAKAEKADERARKAAKKAKKANNKAKKAAQNAKKKANKAKQLAKDLNRSDRPTKKQVNKASKAANKAEKAKANAQKKKQQAKNAQKNAKSQKQKANQANQKANKADRRADRAEAKLDRDAGPQQGAANAAGPNVPNAGGNAPQS